MTENSESIEALEESLKTIREKMHAYHTAREKELLPRYKGEFVGKCFKYKNSYGHGRKWWMYVKILDVTSVNFHNDEEPMFKTLNVQSTSNSSVDFEVQDYSYVRSYYHIPITAKEFDKAIRTIMSKVEKLVGFKP